MNATEPGWLPFTTDDVRAQCAYWGSGAHPLPGRDVLKMADAIDQLRAAVHDLRARLTEATND